MRIGIHFTNFTLPGDTRDLPTVLAATARTAEDVGCSWFTVMDHWFQMEQLGGPAQPMLEGYSALGYVAGQTSTITLGLLVTGVTYRHPGLLAKTVTTIDVLSQGRALLGLGAAWYAREHAALGVPFPATAERFERLEETLQICLQMWSDDDGPYAGRHYQLAETICLPAPVTAPRPPIVIGGMGETKTLRLVAAYADATNMFAFGPDAIAHKLDVLARHCDAAGRDPAEIQKTILGGPDPVRDPDAFLAEMERYAALGVTHVQVSPPGPDPVAWVNQLGDQVIGWLADVG